MTGGHSNNVKARNKMKEKKVHKTTTKQIKKKMRPNHELMPFYRATTLVIQFGTTTIKWRPPQTLKLLKFLNLTFSDVFGKMIYSST